MYCINCGVKLADTESKCPLCETPVCPTYLKKSEPLYPTTETPKRKSAVKAISGVILILYLVPFIVSLFSDLQFNGKIDWFGYVAGALIVSYVTLALPLWFRRPTRVFFVPLSFIASAIYLQYINFATDGNWYFSFALPLICGLCVLVCSIFALLRYTNRGRLYLFGGVNIYLGAYILLIEYLMNITFGIRFIGWSMYPFMVLTLFGLLMIYLAANHTAREFIKRKLFF